MKSEILDYKEDKLKIGKKVFDVKLCELNQHELKFYVDNPRVYSALRSFDGSAPTQKEIQNHMCSMDRVKELKESIRENGGLVNPLIVRESDFAVLEGNSRLAAYRILAESNPIKWGKVKCLVLPADIDDSSIATLLGVYHIVGTKDWSPYEQAGFLYRRKNQSKMPIEEIAKEIGISKSAAEHYIKVFEYMREQDDLTPERWSYYEEFLKASALKKQDEIYDELEKVVVSQIKSGDISSAADIRKLNTIAKTKTKKAKKLIVQYVKKETDLYSAFGELQAEGDLDRIFNKIREFRNYITDPTFEDKIKKSNKHGEIIFDLRKIQQKIKSINDKEKNGN